MVIWVGGLWHCFYINHHQPVIFNVKPAQTSSSGEEVFDLLVLGVFLGEENATEAEFPVAMRTVDLAKW